MVSDRTAGRWGRQDRGLVLSGEQRDAFDHITERGLASVIGYAGTGKSAMLGVAREAWERGLQARRRPVRHRGRKSGGRIRHPVPHHRQP
jgi:hypothetical protein